MSVFSGFTPPGTAPPRRRPRRSEIGGGSAAQLAPARCAKGAVGLPGRARCSGWTLLYVRVRQDCGLTSFDRPRSERPPPAVQLLAAELRRGLVAAAAARCASEPRARRGARRRHRRSVLRVATCTGLVHECCCTADAGQLDAGQLARHGRAHGHTAEQAARGSCKLAERRGACRSSPSPLRLRAAAVAGLLRATEATVRRGLILSNCPLAGPSRTPSRSAPCREVARPHILAVGRWPFGAVEPALQESARPALPRPPEALPCSPRMPHAPRGTPHRSGAAIPTGD